MRRTPFMLKLLPGGSADLFPAVLDQFMDEFTQAGGRRLTVWTVEDVIFGYFEDNDEALAGPVIRKTCEAFADQAMLIASPGNMHLMYDVIGKPRKDTSKLAFRVFITRLKPGSVVEYKRRHDGLKASSKEEEKDSPVNNFTIWNAGDYICGYNEIDLDYYQANLGKPVSGNAEWEEKMLQIMDWLTDDVDWLTHGGHAKIRQIYLRGNDV